MTVPLVMTRLIYLNVWLAFLLLNGLASTVTQTLEKNVFNIAAAATGALVARFFWPRVPVRTSISGWLVGFLLACLFGNSAFNKGLFYIEEVYATWAVVALMGDLIVQFIAWILRVASPIGQYTVEHPGEALDEGLERVEQVAGTAERLAGIWVRIQVPVESFLNFCKTIFPRKP